MAITTLPTPPSRANSPADFATKADALLSALPDFVTEANALADDVTTKQSTASSAATTATTKAGEASDSAVAAAASNIAAQSAKTSAESAAAAAAASYDAFDDRYLGPKSVDPTIDNDGNALQVGALYWNTAINRMKCYSGAVWKVEFSDSADVAYQPSGTGAVATDVQSKLREFVSVKDFGAIGDGVTDDTAAIQAALNSGATTVYFPEGTYNVSSPVMINSYTKMYGDGMDTIIQKTNNTTVTLTDPSSGLSYTRNCCFYVNPAYVPNPDHPSGVDAATQVEVSRIRVRFTATFSSDSSAVFTTQLGRALFQEVYVAGCDWAIDAVRLYLTNIDRVVGRGCRITGAGTSLNITSSGGGGTTGNQYVWKLNGVEYSVMSGCSGEDRVSAYRFDNCSLTLVSCGSELTTSTGTTGSFIDFGDNNNITVLDPVAYPVAAGATGPFISSSGVNNKVRILGGNFNKNAGQAGVYDLWIQANGSEIWYEETVFYDGTTTNLEVQCNGAMNRTGSPAYVKSNGKITKFTPNNVSSPLLQSSFDLLNTATSNEIQTNFTTGGGVFDNLVFKYAANGSDDLRLIKRGSSSSGSFGSTAGGADLLLVGGAGDLAVGTSSTSTGGVRIGSSGTARLNVIYHTYPGGDNLYTLGTGSNRWQVVYAATGTINTSDAREKQQIRGLSAAEHAVAVKLKGMLRAFKFNDAVEKKSDSARIHVGVIAQDVKAAFESEGLVAENYAIFCCDEWVAELDDDGNEIRPAGNRYGVRYEELLAFVIAAL